MLEFLLKQPRAIRIQNNYLKNLENLQEKIESSEDFELIDAFTLFMDSLDEIAELGGELKENIDKIHSN